MNSKKWREHVAIASPGSVMNPVLKKAGYASSSMNARRLTAPVLRKIGYRPQHDPLRYLPAYISKRNTTETTIEKCIRGNKMACARWGKRQQQRNSDVYRKLKRKGFPFRKQRVST